MAWEQPPCGKHCPGDCGFNPDDPDDPCLQEAQFCAGCGKQGYVGEPGWRNTDAAWCPNCAWLA